jgi:lysozyme
MTTSPPGYQLIRDEEGLTLTVKGDTGGKQEVGYGHDLVPPESYPNGIDLATAEFLLSADVARCEIAVNSRIPQSCTQSQFDALIDFTYECGPEALGELLAHGWGNVPAQLPRWVYAKVNGVETVLEGMVTRRAKEVALFESAE